MRAHHTPKTTVVLGEPADWDEDADGVCEGLPIMETDFGVMYSWWKPTWRDRLAMIFGRSLRLGVFGRAHPPVSLDTFS